MKPNNNSSKVEFHFPLERETVVADSLDEALLELEIRKKAKAQKEIKQGEKIICIYEAKTLI
jgi:hypothetical protein